MFFTRGNLTAAGAGVADFPFHSPGGGSKIRSLYDETIFATSGVAPAAVASLLQGFDAVQAFQPAHIFSGTGLESPADAAHRSSAPAGFPQIIARPGGHHLDRPRVVPDPVHGPERADRPELCELVVSAQAHQAFRPQNQ